MSQTIGSSEALAQDLGPTDVALKRIPIESPVEVANAISAVTLRRIIGWLGVVLPLLCYGYSAFFWKEWLPSISHYYYTPVHGDFIAILCGFGFVLLVYRGYDRWDRVATMIAAIFAFGVALFPTARGDLKSLLPDLSGLYIHDENFNGNIHDACAVGLFLMFFFISGFLFTRRPPQPGTPPTWQEFWTELKQSYLFLLATDGSIGDSRRRENQTHRVCAWLILISIIGAAWTSMSNKGSALPFWFGLWETAAILSFAVSWLTKNRWKLKSSGNEVEDGSKLTPRSH